MRRVLLLPVVIFFLISGCSNSSSGPVGSPDPTLTITSNNAMQVGKVAYESADGSQQLGDTGGGLIFVGTQGPGSIVESSRSFVSKIGNAGNGESQVPVPPETISCAVSGTQTVSGEIADPVTPTLTAGDYFQVSYSACDDGLGDIKNGTVRMDIDAFSGDFIGEMFSMTFTLTLTNFQVSVFEGQSTTPTDVLTSNGGATLSLDTMNYPFVSTSISGNSLVVDSNGSSESLTNFASMLSVDGNVFPSPYTTTSSGTLDSTQLAGVIRYSTPVAFEGLGNDYASSGEFLVEGLGSSLRLIAENNVDVRIEVDTDGDGTVDVTINTTWAELTAP